jgi:hypothetical protein
MKRVVCIIAVIFLAVMFVGCASTSSSRFGEDNASGLKGKTEEQIIAQFGTPYKKFTNSDDYKILEYRQSANTGMNTFTTIGSFGLLSGGNSAYADIMKIYLKEKIVQKATFEENVLTLTTTGQ